MFHILKNQPRATDGLRTNINYANNFSETIISHLRNPEVNCLYHYQLPNSSLYVRLTI